MEGLRAAFLISVSEGVLVLGQDSWRPSQSCLWERVLSACWPGTDISLGAQWQTENNGFFLVSHWGDWELIPWARLEVKYHLQGASTSLQRFVLLLPFEVRAGAAKLLGGQGMSAECEEGRGRRDWSCPSVFQGEMLIPYSTATALA